MFTNKNVLVFGAGMSGMAAVRVLSERGAAVTLYDKKELVLDESDREFFSAHDIKIISGEPEKDYYRGFDTIVLSPGISVNIPPIAEAAANGVDVIGEVELASLIFKGKFIAVTGTNGKTTTTTLLYEMVKTLPQKSALGGNIGIALSTAVDGLPEGALAVAEISSFQLETTKTFKPHIAALLNITPDHLDRHGGFEGYAEAKTLVFCNQDENDFLILNYEDGVVRGYSERAKAKVCFFSSKKVLEEGVFVENGEIVIKWQGQKERVCKVSEMKIFGAHNVENALAACACAFFAGVGAADMANVLKMFKGVEHRIEYAGMVNGVKYYNDSKATNPESAIKALEAFPGGVILLAGGCDKMTDLTEFMALVKEKTDALILLGSAKDRFFAAAQQAGVENIQVAESFESAVEKAHAMAKEPQVVLLSPACSSYDMFDNFEQRGCYFKELVHKLS